MKVTITGKIFLPHRESPTGWVNNQHIVDNPHTILIEEDGTVWKKVRPNKVSKTGGIYRLGSHSSKTKESLIALYNSIKD